MEQRIYRDRKEAGQTLATLVREYAGRKDLVVLGLPRGGIPVAYEVAQALRAPLDAFLVGKLGFPGQEELALGAVTSGGVRIVNPELVRLAGLSEKELDTLARRRLAVLERKESEYRRGRPPMPLYDRTVLLVDDGAATGSSMRAAIMGLRRMNVAGIVVALPLASSQALESIGREADEVICPLVPEAFHAVGAWYYDFTQITHEEAAELLDKSREWLAAEAQAATAAEPVPAEGSNWSHEPSGGPASPPRTESDLRIPAGKITLSADLSVPADPKGLVLFSHGSGSGRHSPRNMQVAASLNRAGFATLLMNLLTTDEESADRKSGAFRFDVGLLAGRLVDTTHWIQSKPDLARLKLGYFGASTGAAAALIAAAKLPEHVAAVVSRGGRPDLAGATLTEVEAPTLLIVGGADEAVLEVNREAMDALRCEKKLEIIPGATHLFEERGALEQVSRLAGEWFKGHLAAMAAGSGRFRKGF
jgi:putative phosphoribosyl transferase